MRDFAYTVETDKSARKTIAALWTECLKAGWIVLGDYDMSGLIPDDELERGVEVKSIDICRPEHAKPLVRADPLTALCMPCNVLVRSVEGRTSVSALKPGVMMPRLFPEAVGQVGALPAEVDAELKTIIDAAIA